VAISISYSATICRWAPALWTKWAFISQATESLLNFLADRGYKMSKEKAQLCQSRVTYLGLVLEKEMRTLREDRICPILMFPLLKTLKQLRACWRMTRYCWIWILGYADLARPLY
jgi:hypothetical protein